MEKVRHPCLSCEQTFDTKKALTDHNNKNHKTGSSKYKCQHCDKTFNSKKPLSDHISQCHSSPKFNCEKCDDTFSFKEDMVAHAKSKHVIDDDEYQCELCGHKKNTLNLSRNICLMNT